jgi:hypothetical protein
MARSDEAQAFFHAVYSAAQQIPYGKVTTYAHLAYLVGTRMFLSAKIRYSFHWNEFLMNDEILMKWLLIEMLTLVE